MSKLNKILFGVITLFMGALIPLSLSASVTHLSDSNFESTVSNGTTVVDFYADWCGPCKKFAPTFEKVSNEITGNVKFAKVNIDKGRGIANKYNIKSIPTIILFKDGKEVRRNVGPMTYNTFKNFTSR